MRRTGVEDGLDPENGTYVYSSSNFGAEAILECEVGYFVSGSGSLICNEEEQWYGDNSTCQIVDCGAAPFNSECQLQQRRDHLRRGCSVYVR